MHLSLSLSIAMGVFRLETSFYDALFRAIVFLIVRDIWIFRSSPSPSSLLCFLHAWSHICFSIESHQPNSHFCIQLHTSSSTSESFHGRMCSNKSAKKCFLCVRFWSCTFYSHSLYLNLKQIHARMSFRWALCLCKNVCALYLRWYCLTATFALRLRNIIKTTMENFHIYFLFGLLAPVSFFNLLACNEFRWSLESCKHGAQLLFDFVLFISFHFVRIPLLHLLFSFSLLSYGATFRCCFEMFTRSRLFVRLIWSW